jgi:DNA helicase-2/ATP-dependent DNA helicase PcrA
MESPRELEVERRLFYVAITRAEERCFISYAKSRFKNGQINFANPSRFIKDIDPAFLDQPSESPFAGRKTVFDDDFEPDSRFNRSYKKQDFSDTPAERMKKLTKLTRPQSDVPLPSPSSTLPAGARVRHQLFGEGVVLSVSMAGANEKAEIDFGARGVKTLLLKFAKLEIL